MGELLHVLRWQPGCTQAHVNLGGGQILRLDGFQRLDVFMETRVGDAGGIGGNQLFADIPRKILVVGFPLFGLRVKKNQPLQIRQKVLGRTGQQAAHVFQIHATFFIQRNQQCLFR